MDETKQTNTKMTVQRVSIVKASEVGKLTFVPAQLPSHPDNVDAQVANDLLEGRQVDGNIVPTCKRKPYREAT